VTVFVAGQLLIMPMPMWACLGTVHVTEFAGQPGEQAADACDSSQAARLPLLMLAPVTTAHEHEIAGSDDGRRATWREDRYTPGPRAHVGTYLTFLDTLGYELSPIEQAVADGTPYTGDDSAEPATTDPEYLETGDTPIGEPPVTEQSADEQPGA
jgi:hypothetical protein